MVVAFDRATALIVVDVQNDFADPSGSLYVRGGDDIVAIVNDHVAAARSSGAGIWYTQDWHPPHTPHFDVDGGTWPVHCVRDTWGAELHPDLDVAGDVVRKGSGGEDGYSGFSMLDHDTGADVSTGLDEQLRRRGVEHVVVVGLALDVCVKATAIDAVRLGYRCTVPADASAPVELSPGDGDRALGEMADRGVIVV